MTSDGNARQPLRPRGMRSKPVPMPKVFDDPGQVMELVRSLGPYSTVTTYGSGSNPDPASLSVPWFLDEPDSQLLVQNPHWIAAAHSAFDAAIVQPTRCVVNLNPPAPAGLPHLDLPVFRGFAQPEAPIWLLMAMSRSGLFFDWLVPLASGVAWFWKGVGGEFEYWPQGHTGAAVKVSPPMWNCGVMSDNEVMWHRVGKIGADARLTELGPGVPASSKMHFTGAGWEIRNEDRTVASYAAEEVRISFVWKAYVFRDDEHLRSFEDPAYDLTLDQVVDMFTEDLAVRGFAACRPSEPLEDKVWRALLDEAYVSPFTA